MTKREAERKIEAMPGVRFAMYTKQSQANIMLEAISISAATLREIADTMDQVDKEERPVTG